MACPWQLLEGSTLRIQSGVPRSATCIAAEGGHTTGQRCHAPCHWNFDPSQHLQNQGPRHCLNSPAAFSDAHSPSSFAVALPCGRAASTLVICVSAEPLCCSTASYCEGYTVGEFTGKGCPELSDQPKLSTHTAACLPAAGEPVCLRLHPCILWNFMKGSARASVFCDWWASD